MLKDGQSRDGKVAVVNRMFTGIGFNVKEEFKKVSRATLGIKVKQLNFTENQGRSAAEVINSWVANKTDGKIDGIISSGTRTSICHTGPPHSLIEAENDMHFMLDSLNDQTQVILVNTIHFKSPWQIPFDPDETRAATFYSNPNHQIEVAMMVSEDRYAYGNLPELNATVVVLPYKVGQLRKRAEHNINCNRFLFYLQGDRYSMCIYLPKQMDGLEGFLDALQNATIAQIWSKIRQSENCEKVRLALPKFKIESEFLLVEPLRKVDIHAKLLLHPLGPSI